MGYLDDVYNTAKENLSSISNDDLQEMAPGFEGQHSSYQCLQMALMDNARHWSELLALKARWKRKARNQ